MSSLNNLEDRIINLYRDGSDIGYIVESLNVPYEKIKKTLIDLKESSRYKRTFTDEFKKIIAERDINGVSRRQISIELEINANTVKRACEAFGQSMKDRVDSDNEYTRIDGNLDKSICLSCNSSKVREVEQNVIYCMNCGNEYIFKDDHVLKVNWEYFD